MHFAVGGFFVFIGKLLRSSKVIYVEKFTNRLSSCSLLVILSNVKNLLFKQQQILRYRSE